MRARLCGAVLVCVALSMVTTQGQQARSSGDRFVDGEIIVKFRPSTSTARKNAIVSERGFGSIRQFSALGMHRVRLRSGQSVADGVAAFRALPEVVLAQPNYIRRVVAPSLEEAGLPVEGEADDGDGVIVNSSFLDGLSVEAAKAQVIARAEAEVARAQAEKLRVRLGEVESRYR